jgi:uncharacterized protein YlzI (FlbEa/FlbD family)|tara:strand:- start:1414 stop:1623 length:210 start_codon:yes stop_codon:yes gene_type:complete
MMITLTIMNETGHTELMLEATQVIEQIETHPTHWIFIDGELVTRADITEVNWDSVESVQLSPAIVGGCY